MELNNIFPRLQNIHNFIFVGIFEKHKYYKNISLFKNFNVNSLESNTEWDCKLQTNFHSKGNGLLKDNIINTLSKDILYYVQKELKAHNIKSMKNLFYTDAKPWYNIYKKDFSQEKHNHKGGRNQLSGVYYYKSPSKIRFFNEEDKVDFEPKEGHIILFSSELDHSVPKYGGDDVRITFAFNLGIEKL
jgi:hypothetical protein|tara:strand:+ start:1258 stop:1821 length:564 start_codon:yes stop_codon:yes gene_type:complete